MTSNSSGNGSTNGGTSITYQPVNRNGSGGGNRITTISDLPKPPPKGWGGGAC